MDIEIKDQLVGLKEHHNMLLTMALSYCESPQLADIQKTMNGYDNKIDDSFGIYLHEILYPISYKTNISKQNVLNQNYSTTKHQIAVGKWFGITVNKNISYYRKEFLIDELTEEHINLTPRKKQHVVRDFFNFKEDIKDYQKSSSSKFAVNINTNIYKATRVKTQNVTFVMLKETTPITITEVVLSYSLFPMIIKIELPLRIGASSFDTKEFYSITPHEITSSFLRGINGITFSGNLYLDDPKIFLTNEVKAGIVTIINRRMEIQQKWDKLKFKYAHLLLQKGKI